MITIANLGSIQEAQNLKLKLGSVGIEAFIPDELSAGLAPFFLTTKAGVRLQVEEKDEVLARRIIEHGFDQIDPPIADQKP